MNRMKFARALRAGCAAVWRVRSSSSREASAGALVLDVLSAAGAHKGVGATTRTVSGCSTIAWGEGGKRRGGGVLLFFTH